MPLVRRLVEMDRDKPGRGGHPRTWGYGYPELAKLLGISEKAVRAAVCRKRFQPSDLRSVLRYLVQRRPELLEGVRPLGPRRTLT